MPLDLTKPANCTCRYPDLIARNGCGHTSPCPVYVAWKVKWDAATLRKEPEPAVQAPSPTPGEVERAFDLIRCAMPDYSDATQARISKAFATLRAALPASDCPACGWQGDAEYLDCEAAFEKATGRKLEPGDKEFLTFRSGWIAGHTRAALPAQGWLPIEQLTDRSKAVLLGRCHKSEPNALSDALGLSSWHNRLSIGSPDDNVAWPWDDEPPTHYCELPGDVPTPPNAEPKS